MHELAKLRYMDESVLPDMLISPPSGYTPHGAERERGSRADRGCAVGMVEEGRRDIETRAGIDNSVVIDAMHAAVAADEGGGECAVQEAGVAGDCRVEVLRFAAGRDGEIDDRSS